MHCPTVRSIVQRALLFVAVPVTLVAQSSSGAMTAAAAHSAPTHRPEHAIPSPATTAKRRTSSIAIDGKLDEAAWADANVVTQFTQVDPKQGEPATQRTEIRILFDDDAVYIGAKMYDTEGAAGVRTSLVRRDQPFNSDYIEIVLDSFHDHLGQAFFDVNPSGSIQDRIGAGSACCDSGWDPIWKASAHIDTDGWTAELRIPLSQLRFSRDSVQTWGMQLVRFIQRTNELDQWSYWKKTESGGPGRFGHLDGIEINSQAKKNLELLPYVVGRSKNVAFTPGDPFNSGHQASSRVGLDLKYLLSTNLTLDATINPDFGQVEVDPAVVNLSAFETSFDEKRPFFVAGSGVFSYDNLSCFFCSNVSSLSAFYSRRIGRSPTGADLAYGAGPYADVPDATTILGAAKITGHTSNGFTVGVLDAVTGQANARVQLGDGSRATQEVEPLTNYFVGRVKKDLMKGDLVLGGIATSVNRRMDDTFAPRLNSHSELLGTDWLYQWGERRFSFQGNLAVSSIEGDPRDILAHQESSAHYFQRPDRASGSQGWFGNQLDSTATSMRGLGAYARIAKDAGDWMWESAINLRTPGFENNDIAFLRSADYIWYNANIVRHFTKPTSWYRDLFVLVGGQQQVNFSGDKTDGQLQFSVQNLLPNFWRVSSFYFYRPELADDHLLRGGPLVNRPSLGFTSVSVNSDSRRALIWSGNYDYGRTTLGGWNADYGLNAQYHPKSNIAVSFGPSWSESLSMLQYVSRVSDPTATAFYGNRYVMSSIKQKTLALDTRFNVTFTPLMTLELYAQPFFATGEYFDFKEFDKPRAGNFTVYGKGRGTIASTRDASGVVTSYTIDPDGAGPAVAFPIRNPNFNLRSLRGNAVFRWEYHPGSTLYVAWTHARSDQQPIGDFNFSRDEQGLLATRPDNILLIKASWWLAF
jgi:hypothetical protein